MKITSLLLVLGSVIAGCSDDPERVELELGNDDALSAAGCAGQGGSTTPLVAAIDASGAADVVVEADRLYAVSVDGTGFVTLRSDVAHHDWAVFTSADTTVTSTGLYFPTPKQAAACADEDLWDYRVHIHAVEDIVLELQGGRTVMLYAAREDAGEGHDHDGGHDHDHDGGHDHHDHDGGHDHHHDHDGGHDHHDHDGGHDHEH